LRDPGRTHYGGARGAGLVHDHYDETVSKLLQRHARRRHRPAGLDLSDDVDLDDGTVRVRRSASEWGLARISTELGGVWQLEESLMSATYRTSGGTVGGRV
jgi:hypothetical protein